MEYEAGIVNDTQRLDALGQYGLCVVTHDTLVAGVWTRQWVAQYGPSAVVAPTIREAIDLAVLDITTGGLTRQ
jgi:hypothetical protein